MPPPWPVRCARPAIRRRAGPWSPTATGGRWVTRGRAAPRRTRRSTAGWAEPAPGSVDGAVVQEPEQVLAVAALLERAGQRDQPVVVDEAAPPGDLLDAADLPALPLLDDLHELGGLHHRDVGAGVQPRRAPFQDGHGQLLPPEILVVDRGDLQLAAGAGPDPGGDLDHLVVVEVEPRDGVGALGLGRLLLDGDDPAAVVELHHAVVTRVGHVVGEDVAAAGLGVAAQVLTEADAVEDVVAENERDRLIADEVRADDEGLGQALGPRLDGVGQLDPDVGAVAEQPLEPGLVLGRGDHEDLADPGIHEQGQRVVDHRLVVDRHQLLADRLGDRIEPGSAAARQDDASHAGRVTPVHRRPRNWWESSVTTRPRSVTSWSRLSVW